MAQRASVSSYKVLDQPLFSEPLLIKPLTLPFLVMGAAILLQDDTHKSTRKNHVVCNSTAQHTLLLFGEQIPTCDPQIRKGPLARGDDHSWKYL